MFVDIGVSDDCINKYSYGEICVSCGCCSYNKDYRDRVIQCIKCYKAEIEENKNFNNWCEDEKLKKIQERNVKLNNLYFKRKIRICKKILKTLNRRKANE